MTGSDTVDYYTQRAEHARGLADRAKSAKVRAIHLDLAKRYTQLLYYARSDRPLLTVVDGGRAASRQVAEPQRTPATRMEGA